MKVEVSSLFRFKLKRLLEEIEAEWGKRSREKFFLKLSSTMERISAFPESSGVVYGLKNVRKCVVSKQTSVYYEIKKDHIFVLTISDSRSSLDKINQEIRDNF